jgi:hypothetical protein
MKSNHPPEPPKVAYSLKASSDRHHTSRSTLYRWHHLGFITLQKRGARTLVTEEDDRKIQALLKPLARQSAKEGH